MDRPQRAGLRPAAELAWETAVRAGIEVCFANPGTTEMPLVAALEAVPAMRAVLGLFEGVCTGAADGYARVKNQPATTLLHLGPGFANGIANLHNAKRAHSPVVNIIGDHASWHLPYDAPLTSDIEGLASTVSTWVGKVRSATDTSSAVANAVKQSVSAPGGVSSLLYPANYQSELVESTSIVEAKRQRLLDTVRGETLNETAARVRKSRAPLFLLGSSALTRGAQRTAHRLATALSGRAYVETYPPIAARGGGLADLGRLPYAPEKAIRVLGQSDLLVLVGARKPVSYFGYEGIESQLANDSKIIQLSTEAEDGAAALTQLADALGVDDEKVGQVEGSEQKLSVDPGGLSPTSIGRALAGRLTENAIVSIEGASCGYAFYSAGAQAAEHHILTNTGGALGQGLPCAIGAAIGAPERRVFCLQSDGSAQYTIQSLWTMAREGLPIVVLLASNRKYGILQTELSRLGADLNARPAAALTSLENPTINWVSLAQGYGMEASSVDTGEALDNAIQRGIDSREPYLVEMNY